MESTPEPVGDALAQKEPAPHPFQRGDLAVYRGPRSNRTWGRAEPSMLVVGKLYRVQHPVWATATDGELVPAVRLEGVRSVILETGRASRSYAADNFDAAR